MRADARRNYDKILTAARTAFAEVGSSVSLEEIARRARVGSATLHRNFSSRQALLEAVYVIEMDELTEQAREAEPLEPWEGFVSWMRAFGTQVATKRALGDALLAYVAPDADVFTESRHALIAAAEPLLLRAQAAGAVRTDVDFADATRLIGGVSAIRNAKPEQVVRLVDVALDALRSTGNPRPA
jgi:AcrR family transcriptional regulator